MMLTLKKHNIMIGERTAEQLKIEIGTAYPRIKEKYMEARGRNLVSGLPKTIKVSSTEMLHALEEPIEAIADAVHAVLERTPPELAADISNKGMIMTGGGSLLYGLDKLISNRTGIPVMIADEPISCVAKGTGMSLESLEKYESALMTTSKNSY